MPFVLWVIERLVLFCKMMEGNESGIHFLSTEKMSKKIEQMELQGGEQDLGHKEYTSMCSQVKERLMPLIQISIVSNGFMIA